MRSDLGNLLKALGRLDEAKVRCTFIFFRQVLESGSVNHPIVFHGDT